MIGPFICNSALAPAFLALLFFIQVKPRVGIHLLINVKVDRPLQRVYFTPVNYWDFGTEHRVPTILMDAVTLIDDSVVFKRLRPSSMARASMYIGDNSAKQKS